MRKALCLVLLRCVPKSGKLFRCWFAKRACDLQRTQQFLDWHCEWQAGFKQWRNESRVARHALPAITGAISILVAPWRTGMNSQILKLQRNPHFRWNSRDEKWKWAWYT